VSVQSIALTDSTQWNTCNYSLDYQLSTGSGVASVEVTFASQTITDVADGADTSWSA